MTLSSLQDQLHARLQEQLSSEVPGAAVGVVQDDEVIHSAGYGLASLEWNIPNDADTVFKLASISKPFTALLVMMLESEGLLDLHVPLQTYLPDIHTAGHEVTIHHLLTHTSGIYSYTNAPEFMTHDRYFPTDPLTLMDAFMQIPFDFKPGERYAYNNSAYHLLGVIMEQVSGQSYGDLLQAHILTPCDMHDTQHLASPRIIPRMANGYAYDDDHPQPANYLDMSRTYAAGSLISTVNDMCRWSQKLWSGALVPLEILERMTQPTLLNNGETHPYGYGWGLVPYDGHAIIGHTGGIFGFTTHYVHLPDDALSVIVLTNSERADVVANTMITTIRETLGMPPIKRRPYVLAGDGITRILGDYVDVSGMPYTIKLNNEQKIILESVGFTLRLMPSSKTHFYDPAMPERVFTFSEIHNDVYTTCAVELPFKVPTTLTRVEG